MKKHIIKYVGDPEDRSSGGTYAIFKNPNIDQKNKIVNYNIKNKTFFSKGFKWTVDSYEGDEVKCINGKNTFYFSKLEVDERLNDIRKSEINIEFIPYKSFKESYGIVSSLEEGAGYLNLRRLDFNEFADVLNSPDYRGVACYKSYHEINVRNCPSYGPSFKYELDQYEMMDFHFTLEGDFINRNYNLDLHNFNDYDRNIIQLGILKFKEYLKTYTEFTFYKDCFYFKEFMLKAYLKNDNDRIEIGLLKIEEREHAPGTYQRWSREKIYKKPSKVKVGTYEDLYNAVYALLPADMKLNFDKY